jgi:hypothetical protein
MVLCPLITFAILPALAKEKEKVDFGRSEFFPRNFVPKGVRALQTTFFVSSCMAFCACPYFPCLLDVKGVHHVCGLQVADGVVALRILDRARQWLAGLSYRRVGNLPEDGGGVVGLCQLGQVGEFLVMPDQDRL